MPKTIFTLSSYEEGHVIKKIKSEIYVFGWFPSPKNLDVFFFLGGGGEIYCGASFEIILKSPVFGFCDSLPYGLEKSK